MVETFVNPTFRDEYAGFIVDPDLLDFRVIEERLQNTETINLLRDVSLADFVCTGACQCSLVSPADFRDDGVPNIVASGDSTANALDDC